MLRSRYFWKLFASYAALILATAVLMGLLVYSWLMREAVRDIEASLLGKAVFVREICGTDPDYWATEEFREVITRLQSETGVRITVVDAQGVVRADSEQDPSTMDNHAQRPEIRSARESGVGVSRRYSRTLNKNMIYVAVSIQDESGAFAGCARTAVPVVDVEKRLLHLGARMGVGMLLAVAFALLIALILSRATMLRLGHMVEAVGLVREGDLTARVRDMGRDEIGQLADSINAMAESLQERLDALAHERAKLGAVLSGMTEGVIAVDSEERVIHMNREAGRILGTRAELSEGRKIWELTRIREITECLSNAKNRLRESTASALVRSGNDEMTVDISASPMLSEDGEVRGAIVILRDVTELRRLESVRRDFVSNAAHELQTPLAAARAMVETILDDESMSEERRRRFLVRIGAQIARLSAVVADLLTLSKLESGERAIDLVPLDLRQVLWSVARSFELKAQEKNITLAAEQPDTPLVVMGESEALHQLFGNLVDNAVKYTPDGGSVRIRAKSQDGLCVVEVEDTGIGIEPGELGRIFERFYRVDKGRSRETGGTGLGLSIVKHIAERLCGEVEVESTPGRGSRFTVKLPLCSPDPVQKQSGNS